jgi:hypothetical protein
LINTPVNNKIIVDDEEDEEMKDANKKENEYEPMLNLNKNIEILINKLLPILKLSEEQYEKMFSNVDEEIASKNKEQEDEINELNKSLSNVKAEFESLKIQTSLYQSQINEMQAKIESLNEDNFKLQRKINTHPLMPLLVIEGRCLGKPVEKHDCVCIVCAKTFNPDSQNLNNKEGGNNESNNNNKSENANNDDKNKDNKNPESKNENSNNPQDNMKENETMNELAKENEALRKRISELHENLEEISGNNEITEENILGSKIFQILISQAENILSKLEKMKEINNNLQMEYNSINQKKENEIYQI